MRLISCPKCNSQFDVATMEPGTSFVCGQCRNVLQVPEAGPVVQPVKPGAQDRAMKPPPTVSMTPDQVRRALSESAAVGAERTKPPAQPAQRKPATQRPAAAKPAQAQPQRQLPKAMQKRAQQAASQSGQRAGATGQISAAQAAAASQPKGKSKAKAKAKAKPKSASRSASRSAARSSSGGEKKKSQTGLFAGIGIAVVAIAVVAFLMSRGGGDGETGPAGGGQETAAGETGGSGTGAGTGSGSGSGGGSGTGSGSAGDSGAGAGSTGGGANAAPIDPNDKVAVFLALPLDQQRAEYARKIAGAAGSTDALHALFEFFSEERMATNPVATEAKKTIAETALRQDSNLEWANEAAGRRNLRDLLRACRDECERSFGFAEDDENVVIDRIAELEDGSPWVDATEFKRFEAITERIRAREEELANSPRLVAVEKQKDWVRNNDLFKDFEIIARHEEPYVIFQQYPKLGEGMERYDEQRMEKARHLAKRDGIIFRELNDQFRNLFGARFQLPTLQEKGRLLRVLIMWDRESFDAWHAKQNSGMSGLIRAYYSPPERHIVHYVGTEALTEQDFYKCANGRIQKKSDQVTFHEGTHQLMHEYGNIYRGTPLPEDPGVEVETPPRKSMWFDEGLAEFMGSVEILEDDMQDLGGEFFHNRILLERVQLARHVRRQKAGMWPLAKMLLPNHNGEMLQMGDEVIPGRADLAANLFYAQAWAFVHFSWFYDNGKYRQNFLDYMETVLKGEHNPAALAKAYNLPSADDFGVIEKEYDWYYNLLLRRLVGRKRGGVGWYTPDTDPPEGAYDPNATEDDGDYDE